VTPLPCGVGELVNGRWAGDGRRYLAVLLTPHNHSATVRWLDDDHSHRLVPWRHLTTADGVPCRTHQDGQAVDIAPGHQEASLWRDLARKTKSVDEVSFEVPLGTEGWLLAEVVVAAVRWRPEAAAGEGSDEATRGPLDPLTHAVQVFPGPRAIIAEISRVAVLYHADDMLEQGLRVRDGRSRHPRDNLLGEDDEGSGAGEGSEGGKSGEKREGSTELQLSTGRSVEGLRQLLRALVDHGTGPQVWLPPHVRPDQVLTDVDRLVAALEPTRAVVKKYAHFEAFFAYHWDWATPIDALEVTYERWRHHPASQAEARGAFHADQVWNGSYYCTQGRTKLSLEVLQVNHEHGREAVEADLTFIIETVNKTVRGRYVVAGVVDPAGRALALEPVPGSWKDKPSNFVMVGLQGVVSRVGRRGELQFAGSVPIFGCDSFDLRSHVEGAQLSQPLDEEQVEPTTAASLPAAGAGRGAWNGALTRLGRALDEHRKGWRAELQHLINQKASGKKNVSTQVSQLVEAVRNAGLMSFEMTTSNGKTVVVQLGGG